MLHQSDFRLDLNYLKDVEEIYSSFESEIRS